MGTEETRFYPKNYNYFKKSSKTRKNLLRLYLKYRSRNRNLNREYKMSALKLPLKREVFNFV